MDLLRSRWSTLCAAVLLGSAFLPAPARAQVFVEIVGGSNIVPTFPSGPIYAGGFNVRASFGWKVASNFSWRFDAFTSQFDAKDDISYPCPPFGCPASAHLNSEHVNGLTADGLVNLDDRGVFYLIAGAGVYDVSNVSVPDAERFHFGVSAGAGIAVPMGPRLRGVIEGRWHGLLGDMQAGPTWLMPITIGLRY
jgi:hypothetical protein